jgi:hypothetical protein
MAAAVKKILAWPLWTVLLSGMANALLWERGSDLFTHSPLSMLLCLFALPVVAGFLTSSGRRFTVFVFTFSSGFPLVSHMPPMVIGLWPFFLIWETEIPWVIKLPIVLVVTGGALILMSVPYMFLVGAGWIARRKFWLT